MAKFKNLKVVVSGQFGNGAEYKYGYPIAPTADDPQNNWLKMDMVEKDPLDVGNYFKDIAYPIYKMRVSIYGTYYALVAPCKYDTSGRNGYYSITLFIAKGTKYTGAQVRMTLNNLNEILYEANNFSQEASSQVEQCFEENGWVSSLQEPLMMPVKSVPADKDAYREYSSESEFDTIIQHSMQPEYTGCRWIYLVKSDITPDAQLSKLTTRIRIKYDVVVPEDDIKANKTVTVDGDIMNIVYSRQYFDEYSVSVKIGSPESMKYLAYKDSTITVKSATEAGVVFVKSIKVILFDADGKAVRVVPDITVDNVLSHGSVVKIKSTDLGKKLHIKISAGLYEDAEDDIEADRLVKAPQMRVTLKPRIGGVKLNINIGGKEFSCVETLSPSDPISQSLQRGSFNGYKATRRQNSDEYDIDVTSGRSATVGSKRHKPSTESESQYNPLLARIVMIVVALAIGVAVGVLIERGITSSDFLFDNASQETALIEDDVFAEVADSEDVSATQKNEDSAENVQSLPVQVEPEAQQPDAANEQPVSSTVVGGVAAITSYDALSDEEKADLAYLKKENKWEPAKVKSKRFKEMFVQLENGNIDCLIPLFGSLDIAHVNGYVKIIITNIPKLTAEGREKSKKYLRVNDAGSIATSWAAKKIGEIANEK